MDATHEAADSGLLSPELAAGTSRVKGVKQLGFRLSLFRVAQAQAEPNMNIIDSLLKSKCFLSRRGAENPLSFSGRSSASGNGMDGQVHRAQLGAIVRLIAAEHGKQSMQQFPHDCHHRLQSSFAASE